MSAEPWTCPFCALLCDRYTVERDALPPRLAGSDCPRANDALRQFDLRPAPAAAPPAPSIDGVPATLDAALAAAVDLLRAARQPLIGGLATDVAGMRALYRLAACTGAIVDHAHSDALQRALAALQDRGQYTATLAEIRDRADLVVCFGTQPAVAMPEFWRRCGAGLADSALRRIVFVGSAPDPRLGAPDNVAVEPLAPRGDLYTTLAWLNAAVLGARLRGAADAALDRLAAQLRGARYAVLVWEPAALDAHGAIAAEALHRLVHTLNRSTRAATFAVGGHDGGATAQQVLTWLSGLPLRTRVSRGGLAHEPVRYRSASLLADGAVDLLLWVASFGARPAPPVLERGPRIVLGHPALGGAAASGVFIPVSTPGIGSNGHLFRADGVIALPTPAIVDDGLPTVAELVSRLAEPLRP